MCAEDGAVSSLRGIRAGPDAAGGTSVGDEMYDVTVTRRGHMLRVGAHSLSLFWPTHIPHLDAM